jgi:hypothetical protein
MIMKTYVHLSLLLVLWLGSPTLLVHTQEVWINAAEVGEAQRTATEFVAALQAGDVHHLKQVLAGKAYEQYNVLLEQNQEYPAFLRQYYTGATMDVEEVRKEGEEVVVEVRMAFPSGERNTALLRMQRLSEETMKIVAIDEG